MNSKIKQFIIFGICSIVALAVCLGILVITVNNLEKEQSVTPVNNIESLTKLEDSKNSLVTYINTLVSNTGDRFVKTNSYTSISINEITVSEKTENKKQDEGLLNFVKDKIMPEFDSFYDEDFKGSFKESNSKKLSVILKETLVTNANFSIGQVNESGENILDDEGNLIDEEFYYLTFDIEGKTVLNNKLLSEMFSLNNDKRAKNEFYSASKESLKIKSFNATPETFTIKAKVNRVTDEIDYINVIRNYNITIEVDFINKVDFLGEKQISFLYTVTDTYEYSYAGISFFEDEVTIKHDEEYMLNVNAVIDDDSEYTVEFSSSFDDIASVDEMGYVKGLKNCDVPTIITVKLNYLGETFTDTCVVNVSAE